MAPRESPEFIVTRETCRFLNRRAFAIRFQARDVQLVDYDTDDDDDDGERASAPSEEEEEEMERQDEDEGEDYREEDERSVAARAEAAWVDSSSWTSASRSIRVSSLRCASTSTWRACARASTYIAAVFAATFAVLQVHAKARREAFVDRAELLGEMFRKTRTAFAEATYAAEQVVLRAAKFAALRQKYGAQETTTLTAALARFATESTGRVTLQGTGDTENFLNVVERCCVVLAEYGSLLDAFLKITGRDGGVAARPKRRPRSSSGWRSASGAVLRRTGSRARRTSAPPRNPRPRTRGMSQPRKRRRTFKTCAGA